jgi:nitroreductase
MGGLNSGTRRPKKTCNPRPDSGILAGMDFLELVSRRRSVRRYADRPVPCELLDECLEAARRAPSACNAQPWSFVVTDAREGVERLARAAFSGIYRMNAFAARAPVLVTVITERSKYAARLGGRLRGVQYSLIDIGIAGEHFALAAAERGLGTCWLGWFDEKAVKKTLGLGRRARVDVMLSAGFPEPGAGREKPRRALDEIRRFEEDRPDEQPVL